MGVAVGPACVQQLAGADVVCVGLEGAKVESHIELALHVGESRPIVERFAAIAMGVTT
jgi:hypothetical protein